MVIARVPVALGVYILPDRDIWIVQCGADRVALHVHRHGQSRPVQQAGRQVHDADQLSALTRPGNHSWPVEDEWCFDAVVV